MKLDFGFLISTITEKKHKLEYVTELVGIKDTIIFI